MNNNPSTPPDDKKANVHRLDPSPPEGTGNPFDIPAEQIERIVARASVLQQSAGNGSERQLSEDDIVSIGQEVGLEAHHVRRAIAEFRAEALAPGQPADNPLLHKLFGPAYARVRRVISGNAEQIHRKFESRMRQEERMRPVRMRGTESVWEKETDLASQIYRAFDWDGRAYELAGTRSLSIVAAPASQDSSLVTLTADLANVRNEHLSGWGFGFAFGWGFFLFPFIMGTDWWGWLTVPSALLAGAAVISCTRWSIAGKRRRMALILEGVLDQVEAGRD